MQNNKLVTAREIKDILRSESFEGKRIAFTNGCFDILHYGHVEYLRKSKKTCDILVVGLNSDISIRKIKGPKRPINPEKARAGVLSALELVDYIVLFDDETPLDLIASIKPDILIKGSDWEISEIAGSDIVISSGGEVKLIDFKHGYSTTSLIDRILERYRG